MGINNTSILPRYIGFYEKEDGCVNSFNKPKAATEKELPKLNIVMSTGGFLSNRNIKRLNWLLLISIGVVVAYMFRIKGVVQDLNFELAQLSSQIQQEQNQHSVLKAELAYLRSPERLQRLAMEYLELESIKPTQFVLEDSGNGALNAAKFAIISKKTSKSKWKYKNPNYGNIRTVSTR